MSKDKCLAGALMAMCDKKLEIEFFPTVKSDDSGCGPEPPVSLSLLCRQVDGVTGVSLFTSSSSQMKIFRLPLFLFVLDMLLPFPCLVVSEEKEKRHKIKPVSTLTLFCRAFFFPCPDWST